MAISDRSEFKYFKSLAISDLYIVQSPNDPLGLKWQTGVNKAKNLKANPLIICGSDDELGSEFIKNACRLIQEYDFVGVKRYFIINDGKKYFLDYKPAMPVGTGRIYSKSLLDKIDWKLFDISKNKHLDDQGWYLALKNTNKMLLVSNVKEHGLEVIGIKGNWKMLNPFEPNHPNIEILCVE